MLDQLLKEPDELWVLFSFVLFVALVWFKGRKAIMGALRLYLDFLNMFMFLLRFMGNSRN